MPRWVVALAAVAFDPDVGQKIEALCPANALTEEERRAVAFASLPDSVSALDGGVLVGAAAQATSVRDSTFFFRVKRSSPTTEKAGEEEEQEEQQQAGGERPDSASSDPAAASAPQTPSAAAALAAADAAARYGGASPAFLYGFVLCRQRRDPRLRRGGDQRAVVALSEQPYSATLAPLARAVAAAYFNSGVQGLERAWEEVRRWPPPRAEARAAAASSSAFAAAEEEERGRSAPSAESPRLGIRRTSSSSSREPGTPRPARLLSAAGATLVACAPDASVLPPPPPRSSRSSSSRSAAASSASAATSSLDFRVPRHPLSPLPEDGLPVDPDSSHRVPHGVFPESDVFSPFRSGLLEKGIWHLWEASLTATPTLVLAKTPGQASAFVAALLALIAPLPYGADFRPYLTIHDADAAPLAAAGMAGSSSSAAASGSDDLLAGPRGPSRAGGLPRLVGATNPHFARALGAGWPVVVSLGGAGAGVSGAGSSASLSSSRSLGPRAGSSSGGGDGKSVASQASAAVASLLTRSPPRPGAASPSRLRRAAAAVAGLPVAAAAAAVGAATAGMRSVSSAARGGSGGEGGNGGERGGSERGGGPAPSISVPPPALVGGRALAAAGASATRDVLWSEVKPLVRPDRALLSRLLRGSGSSGGTAACDPRVAAANSAALRRSFRRLTEAFLSLFDAFFDLPGPPPGSARLPSGGPPPPPPFSHSLFLEALADARRDPPIPEPLLERLGSRAGVVALARRFLASPNFASWFERRREAARGWQAAAWEAAAVERGEGPAPAELGESELVDAFAALEARIAVLESALADEEEAGAGEGCCGVSGEGADSVSPPDVGGLSLLRRQSSSAVSASAASVAASTSSSSKKKHHHRHRHHHHHHRQLSAARRRLSCLRKQAAETYAAMPEDLKQAVKSAPSRARLVESLLGAGSG